MADDLKKHRYVFDMGYPYFMSYNNGILGVTSDLGVLVFKIEWKSIKKLIIFWYSIIFTLQNLKSCFKKFIII